MNGERPQKDASFPPKPATAGRVAGPELLAPAGDRDCVRAAVENGADAVYFGLQSGFNARARAANFALEELPELMEFLHRRQVQGYVTVNTLAFPSELPETETIIRQLAEAGVDAILVQDFGVARLARAVSPDLALHASTQMTLTSAETIRVAESLGIQRVVLARELSLDEIAKIAGRTAVELEVFVHGALCVAYGGQCLTSESLGGRSANRGQCAQACRLPYELVCDDQDVELGDVRYLLSPQDLAAYDLVPRLVELGIRALKIEGRLKTPEYVANITRHYRQAIDGAVAGHPVEFTPREVEEMELSFSRGFSHGWLGGNNHKVLVPGLSSAKRGVLVGRIERVARDRVAVALERRVRRGDGLVFEGNRAEGQETGGRIFEIFCRGQSLTEAQRGTVELAFMRGAIDFSLLRPGLQVWKTDDPQLTQRLRKTFGGEGQRRAPLALSVWAEVGRPLAVEARAGRAFCRVESPAPLEAAVKHRLTAEVLRAQLGRLGGTGYDLQSFDAHITGEPMIPLSVLGKVRHAMVAQLDAALAARPPRRIADSSVLPGLRPAAEATPGEPMLHVLCRSLGQLESALESDVRSVIADFADIRQYGEATASAHAAGAEILLATPRIHKPGETGLLRAMAKHGADGWLVRNLAGADFCRQESIAWIADFSLNAANELSAAWLRELGAGRITVSYDLNRDQILDLVSAVPRNWLEVVIHQHMPMFHMEHCVFCAVLSPGTNHTNCGRPCDRHAVRLRDRLGMEHPLTADVGCRNTLFNATPQSAAEVVPALVNEGVRHFRIELLDDRNHAQTGEVIELYRLLMSGELSGNDVWTRLRAANRLGVTRGTLEERRNPLAIL